MFAVIRTGGKQYRVAKDDVIVVEKLAGEPGAALELDQVLMLDDGGGLSVGAPLVDGARVAATVIDQARADKIIVFKKKRRKKYRRTHGHRQDITVLRITDILAKGRMASASGARSRAAPNKDEATDTEVADTEVAEAQVTEVEAVETVAPEAEAPAAEAKPKRAPRRRAAKKDDADAAVKGDAPAAGDESGESEEKS